MEQRKKFIDIFLAKNSQLNLSAIRDQSWVYDKHIRDAIELTTFWQIPKWCLVADLGTGGGIPLLPLAIANPDVQFVWIDGTQKKITAINDMIIQLWISNCKAIWSRGEDLGMEFDVVMARAVAYVDKLIPVIDNLISKWWYIVLYKLDNLTEYEDMKIILRKYKMKLTKKHPYKLFDNDISRIIYIIQKIW